MIVAVVVGLMAYDLVPCIKYEVEKVRVTVPLTSMTSNACPDPPPEFAVVTVVPFDWPSAVFRKVAIYVVYPLTPAIQLSGIVVSGVVAISPNAMAWAAEGRDTPEIVYDGVNELAVWASS